MTSNATVQNPAVPKQEHHDARRREAMRGIYYTPHVDIVETEDELILFADVPGARPDTVDVRYENGELTLHARCNPRQAETKYFLCEYGIGDFYRVFTLDESIDADRITAEIKNGVLTVHLPKAEGVKPKKITVKG